jgi:transposase
MLRIPPAAQDQALFSYRICLEHRLAADHPLRALAAVLDLDFVIPAVQEFYGRSGNVGVDPRLMVKIMFLLFYYNIPSERELMDQIRFRLDFLWFLGLDLESEIPDHSVLSKARKRWGTQLFEELFARTVKQCVQAGLVDGRLLHIDSTTIKANASKGKVVSSSPELVSALRRAYQEQEAKLAVLPAPTPGKASPSCDAPLGLAPAPAPLVSAPVTVLPDPVASNESGACAEPLPSESEGKIPDLRVLPPPPKSETADQPSESKAADQKLPVNSTHISRTDPEAELARSKNGVTDLNYKDHRIVDNTHGVITAVEGTGSTVADGTQLPSLMEQHLSRTGLKLGQVTIAGDGHYGTASNYLFCAQEGIGPHLAEATAHLAERGNLPLSEFVYEPEQDRLRCPQGHYLDFHQNRPQEQAKVYLIQDPAQCAGCPLKPRCTKSAQGRSIQRHVQAQVIAQAQAKAKSPAGRFSRKRRQHVMEGSFADAANNHGSKRARWRGLWRQQIQGYFIAAVQNLRILIKRAKGGPVKGAAAGDAKSLAGTGASGLAPGSSRTGKQTPFLRVARLVWLVFTPWDRPMNSNSSYGTLLNVIGRAAPSFQNAT